MRDPLDPIGVSHDNIVDTVTIKVSDSQRLGSCPATRLQVESRTRLRPIHQDSAASTIGYEQVIQGVTIEIVQQELARGGKVRRDQLARHRWRAITEPEVANGVIQ